MTLPDTIRKQIETALVQSEMSLDDFLEQFDIDQVDALLLLYEAGLIDTELFERIYA